MSPAPFELPGVGRFARTSEGLRPALPASGKDRSTRADRQLATAAAATVVDAFRRTFIAGATDHGTGLRGGTVKSADDDTGLSLNLGQARWVEDVGVTGQGRYDFQTNTIDANVALAVTATIGEVRVSGVWTGPRADHTHHRRANRGTPRRRRGTGNVGPLTSGSAASNDAANVLTLSDSAR